MIPVRNEFICIYKCARCEFKLYLFTEVYYVTFHSSLIHLSVCEDIAGSGVAQICVLTWSKLQQISRAQGVGSSEH